MPVACQSREVTEPQRTFRYAMQQNRNVPTRGVEDAAPYTEQVSNSA